MYFIMQNNRSLKEAFDWFRKQFYLIFFLKILYSALLQLWLNIDT